MSRITHLYYEGDGVRDPDLGPRTPEEEAQYKEFYHDAYWHIANKIYGALNTHVQLLAEENGVVVSRHKFPCFTITRLIQAIKQKHGLR